MEWNYWIEMSKQWTSRYYHTQRTITTIYHQTPLLVKRPHIVRKHFLSSLLLNSSLVLFVQWSHPGFLRLTVCKWCVGHQLSWPMLPSSNSTTPRIFLSVSLYVQLLLIDRCWPLSCACVQAIVAHRHYNTTQIDGKMLRHMMLKVFCNASVDVRFAANIDPNDLNRKGNSVNA